MGAASDSGQNIGLFAGLKQIYARASARRRRQLFVVLALMLAGAIAELATIGSVIPFLALLTGSGVPKHHGISSLFLPASASPARALIIATAAFMLFATVAGIVRLQLAWSSRSFIFGLGHEIAVEIQRRVLLQPFSFHTERNSSTLMSALAKTETLVLGALLPLMQAVTSGLIATFVAGVLLAIAPLLTLSVAASLGVIYAIISVVMRRRLAENSRLLETAFDERLQTVQESLGGIRDVIIDNAQAMYLRLFAQSDWKLSLARFTTDFINTSPRFIIETLGLIVIAVIAFVSGQRPGGIAEVIPVLGALALGAQRLLPLVQQVYVGWGSVAGNRSIFGQVVELLQLPVDEGASERAAAPLELKREIRVERVGFRYATRRDAAVEDVSFAVPRGAMLALVGPTGSGKSTLMDLMMGLLPPDEGEISVDEIVLTADERLRWHRTIAHVPQSIFLADTTIARNIALSLPNAPIDLDRIVQSARKAQLHEFVSSLPAGYETAIGERGIRLSGGQRQRLGIARAIYKDTPILFLDEATSALDDATEAAVMSALKELRREGRTIVIVAHRQSTVRHCDLVARLKTGRLVALTSQVAPAKAIQKRGRTKTSAD